MGQMEIGNIGMESGDHEVSSQSQDDFEQNEASPDQIFNGGSTLSGEYGINKKTSHVMTPEETARMRDTNLKEGSDWREQA